MNEMIMVVHSLDNNTCTGLDISLFKWKSFDQSDPPEWPQALDIYSLVVLESLHFVLLRSATNEDIKFIIKIYYPIDNLSTAVRILV